MEQSGKLYQPQIYIDTGFLLPLEYLDKCFPLTQAVQLWIDSDSRQTVQQSSEKIVLKQERKGIVYSDTYGFRTQNGKRKKYIQSEVHDSDLDLTMGYFITRSDKEFDGFKVDTTIVRDRKHHPFVTAHYRNRSLINPQVNILPCNIRADSAAIGTLDEGLNSYDRDLVLAKLDESVHNGSRMLYFSHPSNRYWFEVDIPTGVAQGQTRELLGYFSNPNLPKEGDKPIRPQSLGFATHTASLEYF